MTEEQRYDVVRTEPEFELRHYPQHIVAEVEVEGTFESAGTTAFRPLVSYIGGRNASSTGLAMTAPVIQRREEPQDLGAVTTAVTDKGRYVVSFVLPDDVTTDTVPAPSDTKVIVRAVPEEYAAVSRFSGRWTASSYRTRVDALTEAVAAAGLTPTGPARFARFDPPWTPWFRRRNEVVLPVASP
jgi:hypothetical protein